MTLMTTNEAARYLRYSPSYMRKLVMLKKLPFVKLDGAVRFRKEDLDEYVDRHLVVPESAFDFSHGR